MAETSLKQIEGRGGCPRGHGVPTSRARDAVRDLPERVRRGDDAAVQFGVTSR